MFQPTEAANAGKMLKVQAEPYQPFRKHTTTAGADHCFGQCTCYHLSCRNAHTTMFITVLSRMNYNT